MRAVAAAALLLACQRPAAPAPAARAESCLDRELSRRGLNEYGDPPGTVYAGGTPLFDERSGKSVTRDEYVRARHPEVVVSCDAGH